jgi:hypothetical protein
MVTQLQGYFTYNLITTIIQVDSMVQWLHGTYRDIEKGEEQELEREVEGV